MKTKVKIIIIAIAIISTVILIGLTNSRYFTQVELVGDFEVATAIIDIEEQTKTEEIEKLLPGDTFDYYFSVNNYDTEGNLNELLMQYSIEIETADDNVLPLEYTIYELKEDGTTVEITNSNDTFELPFCNSENDKNTRNFKIVFTWNEDKNEAETYADKTYTVTVKAVATYSNYTKTAESEKVIVTSKPYQELKVSIEETGETNVYNVTITNNNDYDVKCSISLDNEIYDISYKKESDGYLTVVARDIVTIEIELIELDDDPAYNIVETPSGAKQILILKISVINPYKSKDIQLEIEQELEVIDAETVKGNPQKYYGARVNYNVIYNNLDDASNYWRIYFSDGESIYLITDYYLDSDLAPKINGESVGYGDEERMKIKTSLIKSNYNGTTDFKNSVPANEWANMFLEKASTSTSNPAKIMAYLLDEEKWTKALYSPYAEYTIGSPTIELYDASNSDLEKSKYTLVCTSNGYYFNLNGAAYSERNITSSETRGIYESKFTYYFASPYYYGNDYLMYYLAREKVQLYLHGK